MRAFPLGNALRSGKKQALYLPTIPSMELRADTLHSMFTFPVKCSMNSEICQVVWRAGVLRPFLIIPAHLDELFRRIGKEFVFMIDDMESPVKMQILHL